MLDPKTANLQGIFGFSMGLNVSPWAAKKAKNTHLSIPNGPGSLLEKHAFDPFLTHLLTHFWCHKGPLSSNFGIFHGPKRVITSSKRAKNTCWRIPNGPRSVLENCVFDPFLPIFGSKKAHFQGILRFSMGQKKCVTTGSKRAENTYLSIPNDTTSLLERHVF